MKPRRTIVLILAALFAAAVLAILLKQRRERAAQEDADLARIARQRKAAGRGATSSPDDITSLFGGE